jgi:FkbM family methyltransferase
MSKIVHQFKPLLAKTLWPEGAVRTILWGPCRGLRYRIFPDMGLSPIYGGWEEEAQNLMQKHIRQGFVVYDVGGNYGIHTLLFARLVKEQGHVYTFEPLSEILAELESNVALNDFRNVTCLKLAVDSQTGTTDFFKGYHVGAGHLATGTEALDEKITVETITLDDFVFEQGQRPPDFIKIDVEGAESRVLEGCRRTLKTARPIVLVDLHNPEQDVLVGQILSECRYDAYHTEDGSIIKDLSKGWPHQDGIWGQIIALPKD